MLEEKFKLCISIILFFFFHDHTLSFALNDSAEVNKSADRIHHTQMEW
jgi:hypothetical protein